MKEEFKTSIGGQALIEGIMMRGPEKTAMAVRRPDQDIVVEEWDTKRAEGIRKLPILRGIFGLVTSLILGYKCLMRSAEIAGFDDEEPSKFEVWLAEKTGIQIMTIVSAIALVFGLGLSLLLFVVLPTTVAGLIHQYYPSNVLRAVIEAVMKITLFVGYLWLVSRVPDIKRVFAYHGAEHKSIACYEAGLPLTVENIRPQSRFHPRCGTSFLLIVLIISIIVFSIISVDGIWLRMALKVLCLPLIVGITGEINRYVGGHHNLISRIISAPGLWLQRLTTLEPDDSQIEVAIASLVPVIPGEKGLDQW